MSERLVVLITASSQEEADQIAHALVFEMLAASANVIPGVNSVYRWEGEVRRAQEWLLVVKTRRDVLDRLIHRVQDLHSYEVPALIALPAVGGSADYLRWLDQQVEGGWHAVD